MSNPRTEEDGPPQGSSSALQGARMSGMMIQSEGKIVGLLVSPAA
jgi:hypothetical protein